MNYYAFLQTLCSLLLISLAIYVYKKSSKLKTDKLFFVLNCYFSLWIFIVSLICWLQSNGLIVIILCKIGLISLIFFPFVLFHFILCFLGSKFLKYINYLYSIPIFFLIVGLSTNLFINGVHLFYFGYYPVAGSLFFVLILQTILLMAFSIYLLYKNLKNKEMQTIKIETIKYFIFALYLLLFFMVDYIVISFKLNIYPFVITISFCILKSNLINFKLALVQVAVSFLVFVCAVVIPFFIGIKTDSWFLSVIMLLAISLSGPYIFKFFKNKFENLIFVEQEKYHETLLSLSKSMVEERDVLNLSQLIVRILNKTVKIKFSALFIYLPDERSYCCVAKRGLHIRDKNMIIDEKSEIINYIKMKSSPILLNGNCFKKSNSLFDVIHDDISLVVPIKNVDKLTAFVIMGEKLNGLFYSRKDLYVFKILANKVSYAIENCKFLTKVSNQQYQLFEADRLTKIGQMADGFANQLKNRLNQFYLVGEGINYELNSFKSVNEDFIRHDDKLNIMLNYIGQMADSIIDDVKRTNTLLQNILNFSKSHEHNITFSSLSLRQVIEQCLNLLKIKHQKEKIPLVLHLPSQDEIYGIKNQIQRIFFNCLDNDYEAILEKQNYIRKSAVNVKDYIPNITIELKYIYKNAKIYIHDNGIGIKDENKKKIFSAFFTTKLSEEKNSGMGLYTIKQMIIENHKGDIQFRSKYGYGTTFLITLPTVI